jgi:hypothetical protein
VPDGNNVQMDRHTDIELYRYTYIEMYRCTDVQMCRRTDVKMYRCTDIQAFAPFWINLIVFNPARKLWQRDSAGAKL